MFPLPSRKQKSKAYHSFIQQKFEQLKTHVENENVIYSDEKHLEEPDTLESICEHRALLRHYDGYFVTFCPRCGKILHIYHTVNLLRGYALVEGRIRELEKQKGE